MPGVPATGSPNIAIVDSKIVADLCGGKFYVDATPSIYIGSGKDNVLGANVQIVNPYGVTIKPYGSNYEISPILSGGMDVIIAFDIPTQAGSFQTGQYIISLQMYDADGKSWVVTKKINVCAPDRNNKTRKFGTLSAILKGSCKDGKVYVIADSVPTYNGVISESQENSFTLEYPTSSGLPILSTTLGNFSVVLFEGEYIFKGTICATYNFGDNVYAKVSYNVKRDKEIKCIIDECCVFGALAELNSKKKEDCSQEEINATFVKTSEALVLLKTAQLAADCGEDPTEYVSQLEDLLGCQCTCNCNEGTPIINSSPARDFNITGCNVTKTTVGLTDSYVIDNYEYVVKVAENGGALVVSSPTLDGCTKTQILTFNIATVYSQIKGLANVSVDEANFWASIINKAIDNVDLSCLPDDTWVNKTFKERVGLILARLCSCCGCSASIEFDSLTQNGSDVVIKWKNPSSSVYLVDVYVDGLFVGSTLAPNLQFNLAGIADGLPHTWVLIPKCSNGDIGTPINGSLQDLFLCPDIEPPTLSSNSVSGVECPFDLTTLVTSTPPLGITYEWFTTPDHKPGTAINPVAVNSGTYYIFAKNSDGCYSPYTSTIVVQVICESGTSCSAPQTLTATKFRFNNNVLVMFQSAAFPPPGNSYTVKRRLYSDPDVSGSYTIIGTPVWDVSFNRWVIIDSTASNNTLYVYRAISNCGGSPGATPYTDVLYANILCPSVTLTPHSNSIDYSFTPVGGQVDKIEVLLYDSTGTVLIHTDTFIPAFSNPITGSFSSYLSPNTQYRIGLRICIGTFCKDCSVQTVTTLNSVEISRKVAALIGDVCGAAPTSLFIQSPLSDIATDVIVYDDEALTTPHVGDSFIINISGNIFNLDSSTGKVGSDTLTAC